MKLNLVSKFSLLSIAILLMSHLAISPVIPNLYEFYHNENPNVGLASVENLVTIPAMTITIFVLISNICIKYIGKKNTVLLGLTTVLIGGLIPFFTTEFNIVFFSRLLLGAGIGLFNPLSVSLINDYFEGDFRGTMIGIRTAFLNMGKALTTFISGYLFIYGIQYTFLVYLLAIPIFILFFINVPNINTKESTDINIKIHKETALIIFFTFFVGLCYTGSTIKIPTLLVENYGFSVDVSRNILTVLAVSGIFSGFIFGKMMRYFKDLTLTIMLGFMALGNIIFTFTKSLPYLYVASILIGVSFVALMSFNFFYVTRKLKPKYLNFATSLVLVGGNSGVIFSPIVLTKIPEFLHLEKYIMPFYIVAGIMVICAIISIFTVVHNKK